MASQQATQHQELDKLVECYLHDPIHRKIAIDPTFMHRINIVNAWRIPTSAKRLLDIGCGQGESSLTLANAFPDAHVTGIDSASPDYGAPITLGQSQAYILGSPLGNRITFETADPISYLLNGAGAAAGSFDTALFCHSLWYWSSVEQIRELFAALAKSNVSRICIAEWSGTASSPDQEPHVLAAKVQKELFALRPASGASSLHEQNIRTGLSPDELFELAAEAAGWRVAKRGIVKPPSDLREGVWETDYVKSDDFRKTVEVASERLDDEKKAELLGYQDLVRDAVEKCGGRNQVKCMDVVWAVLERDAITA